MLVSALHHAAVALAGWQVVFIGGPDPNVETAIDALRWDTGLDATVAPRGREGALLAGARLFAAVSFRDTAYLPLATVQAQGVPIMVAVQFPDPARHGAAVFALQRAAHDPGRLADAILARVAIR